MATVDTVQPDVALMIDIETLSLRPDAFVTQVGLCVANTRTREYLKQPTNYWLSPVWQKGAIDFDTVKWWMNQDPKVAAGVFNAPKRALNPDIEDRVSPRELFHIIEAIVKAHAGITVWGSPAMFDLPVLTSMWSNDAQSAGSKPWKYNSERDMMTLYKYLDPEGKLQPPANDKAHDAAADAQWQMEYLFRLMDRLRMLEALGAPKAVIPLPPAEVRA
jgi:hypothetical protein